MITKYMKNFLKFSTTINSFNFFIMFQGIYLILGVYHYFHANNVDHFPMFYCFGAIILIMHSYLPKYKPS
jgi:hypothetical protein